MSSVNIDTAISVLPATPVSVAVPNFGVVAVILLTLAAAVIGISFPNANISAVLDDQTVQLSGL
jgi:hypothetical protein